MNTPETFPVGTKVMLNPAKIPVSHFLAANYEPGVVREVFALSMYHFHDVVFPNGYKHAYSTRELILYDEHQMTNDLFSGILKDDKPL
jgi:hypothetical protein